MDGKINSNFKAKEKERGMSWQVCPLCQGSGMEGAYGIRCSICDGMKIINEANGNPPERKGAIGDPWVRPQNLTGE